MIYAISIILLMFGSAGVGWSICSLLHLAKLRKIGHKDDLLLEEIPKMIKDLEKMNAANEVKAAAELFVKIRRELDVLEGRMQVTGELLNIKS